MAGHHDVFFKQTFSIRENAADFARHVLPKGLASGIDYSTLQLDNTSYVDKELSEHFSDMVYSCRFGPLRIALALLFEHKSRPERNLPYQLNRYMIRIWEANIKQNTPLVPVVPVVIYHGAQRWKPGSLPSCFGKLPAEAAPFVPDFRYVFMDLSRYSDEDIKGGIFAAASLKIALLIMKNIRSPEKIERHLTDFLEVGRLYFQEDNGLNFLESVIRYIFRATEIETEKLMEAVEPISSKGGELVMTTAEKLRQEGLQEGAHETLLFMVNKMKERGLPEEDIAGMLDLDPDSVRKLLSGERIELPLPWRRNQ